MGNLGERIRELRDARRLTQHDLASNLRKRGYGTTQTTISRWEGGQTPRGHVLEALASELGVTLAELLKSDDDEEDAAQMPLARDLATTLHAYVQHHVRAALAKEQSA